MAGCGVHLGTQFSCFTCRKVQILTQKALVECRVVSMAESGDAKHHIVSAQVCCLPLELKHAGVRTVTRTVPRLLELQASRLDIGIGAHNAVKLT